MFFHILNYSKDTMKNNSTQIYFWQKIYSTLFQESKNDFIFRNIVFAALFVYIYMYSKRFVLNHKYHEKSYLFLAALNIYFQAEIDRNQGRMNNKFTGKFYKA